ncbi:MAG: SRPBCC family protein [Verrucomicrobiae bacterium]|nr:SRPBCC family protein [Verrucomicrobiae bacterium]NNJ41849.1 SRPBCC family protein [Akkermansiaceae bacterium]
MIYQLHRTQLLDTTLESAWEFFSSPRNLDRLTPKSVGFKITHCSSETMHPGQIIGYKIKVAPWVWLTWLTEITFVTEKESFIDDQRIGPYKIWHHTHHFQETDDGVIMTDTVVYVMPFGILGQIVHALFVKRQLNHIFDERKRLTDAIFNASNA